MSKEIMGNVSMQGQKLVVFYTKYLSHKPSQNVEGSWKFTIGYVHGLPHLQLWNTNETMARTALKFPIYIVA